MNFDKEVVDLCIAVLLKNDVSVVIGYEVTGSMKALRRNTSVYNSELKGLHYLKDGTRFDFPRGEFHVSTKLKE